MAAEDEAESVDHIHHFGDLDSEIYLTGEEHDMFTQVDDKTLTGELEQYHKGYMHAIDDVRKIKLRSRDVTIHKKGNDSTSDAAIHKGGLNPNQPYISQIGLGKGNEKQKGPMAPRGAKKGNNNVRELEPVALV